MADEVVYFAPAVARQERGEEKKMGTCIKCGGYAEIEKVPAIVLQVPWSASCEYAHLAEDIFEDLGEEETSRFLLREKEYYASHREEWLDQKRRHRAELIASGRYPDMADVEADTDARLRTIFETEPKIIRRSSFSRSTCRCREGNEE